MVYTLLDGLVQVVIQLSHGSLSWRQLEHSAPATSNELSHSKTMAVLTELPHPLGGFKGSEDEGSNQVLL